MSPYISDKIITGKEIKSWSKLIDDFPGEILKSIFDYVLIIDRDLKVYKSIVGYNSGSNLPSLGDDESLDITKIFPDIDPTKVKKHVSLALHTGSSIQFDASVHCMRNDKQYALCLKFYPLKSVNSRESLVALVAWESSSLKEKEEEPFGEEFSRAIIQNLSEGVTLLDREGIIIFANHSFMEMTGCDEDQILGRHFSTFLDLDTFFSHQEEEQTINSEKKNVYEVDILKLTGKSQRVLISSTPHFREGKYRGSIKILTDITEKKELEEKLHQTEKFISMGQIASYVIHEIKNPLSVIKGYSEIYLRKCEPDNPFKDKIEIIHDACDHIMEILHELRGFSGPDRHSTQKINLNDVITVTLKLFRHFISHSCKVSILKELDRDLHHVMVNPTEMQQVLMNIFLNACEAMREGGIMTIATNNMGEDGIRLSISDTGCGICRENLEHIFKPYFTHGKKKGTGYGLAITKEIVRRNRGAISVESTLGKGTTFTVRFPASQMISRK